MFEPGLIRLSLDTYQVGGSDEALAEQETLIRLGRWVLLLVLLLLLLLFLALAVLCLRMHEGSCSLLLRAAHLQRCLLGSQVGASPRVATLGLLSLGLPLHAMPCWQ